MTHEEAGFRLATVLLTANCPITLRELTAAAEVGDVFGREAADRLVQSGEAKLVEASGSEPRYRWSQPVEIPVPRRPPAIDSAIVQHFVNYVLHSYSPPAHVEMLAIFQCCVGRPFYRTQSHGFMRHALQAATGLDPYFDATSCPVHVVVLGSWIGPVPYELQNIYPATVSAGGVKQMSEGTYAAARPILVRRMADYLLAHGSRYSHIATFTDGRYADVMREAGKQSGREIAVLPNPRGPKVLQYKGGKPRTYWQSYWVQLALDLGRASGCCEKTLQRLHDMGVEAIAGVGSASSNSWPRNSSCGGLDGPAAIYSD